MKLVNRKDVKAITILSLIFAGVLIVITPLVGGLIVITTNSNQAYNFLLGYPHPWIHISHTDINTAPMFAVLSWSNLIMNGILYFLLVFFCTYLFEMFNEFRKQIKKSCRE